MQKYSKYKDSGVKWLGEIPSHWEVKHLRNFLTLFSEKGFGDSQLLSVTREKGVILRDRDNKEENHNFVPDDLSGYKHLNAGDFVINKMKSWQGSYGVSDYEGIVSPAYFTCKLHGINSKFFSRAIRSRAYIGFFMQFSKGIRVDQWDLDPNSMKEIPFVVPSNEEQIAIVNYLDSVTSKIDEAIAQQQKMIDLLNERKQIIINDAVTKGLDPKAKMKDSGIDWIGQIPEHWEIRKLKYMLRTNLMYGANESAESDDPSFPRYIRITDIDEDGSLKPDTFRSLPPLKAEPYLLDKGDLLFARSGATAGKTYLFNEDAKACFAGYLIKASLKDVMMPGYLNYYTKSGVYDNWKKSIFIQATIPNIGADKYANLLVTLPSKKEQQDIIKYLDLETGKVNQVVSECKEKIALLQERKQIIINDVVTGKVKVA